MSAAQMLIEAHYLKAMSSHHKAIGEHVAKGEIEFHHQVFKDDYKRPAKTPSEVGRVLHRAYHSYKNQFNDSLGNDDYHIPHAEHFDAIKKHTHNYLKTALSNHMKKYGKAGAPMKDPDVD